MEDYLNKKLPDGSYVYHEINYFGNSIYGIPGWIGAYDILKIMDNAEKDILAYYDNDAIAKTVMMLYNIGNPDKQINKDLKSFLEKNFQGVTNRHKLWILSGLPRKTEGQIDFHELNKNIVDANYLNMTKENKIDTCVAFGVPIELLGVSSAGKLGNTQELRNLTIFFNDNKILPDQERFYQMINPFFPDIEIKLKQMDVPEVDPNEQPLVMQQKSQDKMVEQFQGFMMMLAQYVVENEEK
jgi:capsid portal protein